MLRPAVRSSSHKLVRRDLSAHIRLDAIFPTAIQIPMSREMTITQWHVPVDDKRCYWYAIFTSFGAPVDHDTMRAQRLELYALPDYIPRVGKANNYGYDADEQVNYTYTGMGQDITPMINGPSKTRARFRIA